MFVLLCQKNPGVLYHPLPTTSGYITIKQSSLKPYMYNSKIVHCQSISIYLTWITNVLYSLFLQLIGGAIFGFSMWLLVDFFVNEYQAATAELKESKYVIYVFVAASAFMVVYSLIGIFGAIKPSWKCLLVIVSPVRVQSQLASTSNSNYLYMDCVPLRSI